MSARAQLQRALDDAAEVIRSTYPQINGTVFAATQIWFGKYQHLLTKGMPSKVLEKAFGNEPDTDNGNSP